MSDLSTELRNRAIASVRCDWEDTRPATRHALGFLYLTIAVVGLICFPTRHWPAPMQLFELVRMAGIGIYFGLVAPAAWRISRYDSVEHWEADVLDRDVDEWRAEVEARRERAARYARVTPHDEEPEPPAALSD